MPIVVKGRSNGGGPGLQPPASDESFPRARIKALMNSRTIRLVPVSSLKSNPRNAKKHPVKQVELLSGNIARFGFNSVIVADETGMVLCGHARLEAARQLGLEDVPVMIVEGLSANEKRALAIGDNRLSELGAFDTEVLKEELSALFEAPDLDFDLNLVGYETVDYDQLLVDQPSTLKADSADEVPSPALTQPAVSRVGDLWLCGRHKLLCGTAINLESYNALLEDELAQLVFTDPPYNVKNKGHVSRRANVREFPQARGEMPTAEYIALLRAACVCIDRHCADGCVVFVCNDWRHLPDLMAAAYDVFGAPKNFIVWAKTNAGLGSFYRSQHEFILPFVSGGKPPINNFQLGAKGRFRSNLWTYPGFNCFGRDRDEALGMHPTVKPVALVVDALLDCSHRKGIVLDPFGGSGTTMIAAERTGRCARLIELDAHYCDVIVRRWEKFTSKRAVLAGSGQTFDDISDIRAGEK